MMIAPADLRLRIIASIGALLLFTAVETLPTAIAALLAVLALHLIDRRPVPWKRLLHLEAFLILLFIALPFTVPGTPVFHIGRWPASAEGVARATFLAARVTTAVLFVSRMFSGVDPVQIGRALGALRVPHSLVRLFVSTGLHLGVIRAEFSRLQEAMQARAFRPGSNRHSWRSYGYLVGMLIVCALRRAERMEEAMRLRGYRGRFPRTGLPPPPAADWAAGAVLLAAAAAFPLWERL